MSGAEKAIPPALTAMLEQELCDNEQLLWTGQPNPVALARKPWYFFLFGIAFVGGPVAGMPLMVPTSPLPGPLPAIIIMSILGVFLTLGFLLATLPLTFARLARKTLYAVTDRRALIFEARPFASHMVWKYGPAHAKKATIRNYNNGLGDLLFFCHPWQDVRLDRGFNCIDDLRGARQAVDAMQEGVCETAPVGDESICDPAVPDELKGLLDSEERVAWLGHPLASALLRRHGLLITICVFVLFMLTVTQLVIFSGALPANQGPIKIILAIGFGAFQLFALAGLVIIIRLAATRKRVTYLLTNRRAIEIRDRAAGPAVHKSYAPQTMHYYSRSQRANGTGNLYFLREDRFPGVKMECTTEREAGFLDVKNVAELDRLVRASLALA